MNTSNHSLGGIALILAAATLWGTTGTSQALAPDGATPLAVGAMRLFVGGAVLWLLARMNGHLSIGMPWHRPAFWVAGIMAAIYQVTFFGGVALTSVAVGTIVGIGSAPIFAGILGAFLYQDALKQAWWIATTLAITGVVLLALSGDAELTIDPIGILLSLGAGLSYSIFTAANKRLVGQHPPDLIMAGAFGMGAVFLLPTVFLVDFSWVATTGGLLISFHLGVLATGLSYALYGRGLQTVSVATVGTLTLAEPLTAALLGVLVVGETLNTTALLGCGAISLGLIVLVTQRGRS